MTTVCVCGFDYAEFVARHQIPAGAKFDCPGCDTELHTGAPAVGGEARTPPPPADPAHGPEERTPVE